MAEWILTREELELLYELEGRRRNPPVPQAYPASSVNTNEDNKKAPSQLWRVLYSDISKYAFSFCEKPLKAVPTPALQVVSWLSISYFVLNNIRDHRRSFGIISALTSLWLTAEASTRSGSEH